MNANVNQSVASIVDALSYINKFRGNTFLIKLGGSVLYDEALIKSLCDDLKLLIAAGIKLVIVHGGGQTINKYLSLHQIEAKFIDGLRVTSTEAMKVIEMVLCGHVNNLLVRKLNHIGINAVGLSGADNNLFLCDYYSKQHGCVGTLNSINTSAVKRLISTTENACDIIPVIAPVGVDAHGNPMNINADYAASHLAIELQVDKLIFLTDQDGIADETGQLCSELSTNDLKNFIHQNIVQGGMLTKARAILDALSHHLSHVHILNGKTQHVLIKELFTVHGTGTLCKAMTDIPIEEEAIA